MTMKQRQRRRSSLSGRNSYLENMSGGGGSPSSASSNVEQPKPQQQQQQQQQQQPPKPFPSRGFGGSYLDSLSASADTPPKAEKNDFSIGNNNNNRNSNKDNAPKGSVENYLDALYSNVQQPSSDAPKTPMKDEPSDNPFVEEVR